MDATLCQALHIPPREVLPERRDEVASDPTEKWRQFGNGLWPLALRSCAEANSANRTTTTAVWDARPVIVTCAAVGRSLDAHRPRADRTGSRLRIGIFFSLGIFGIELLAFAGGLDAVAAVYGIGSALRTADRVQRGPSHSRVSRAVK